MDMYLVDDYPADTAYGNDFLSGNDKGKIQVETPDGDVVLRDERILVTTRDVEFEGRICVGERTIRHMAHQFGLVDEWKVDRLKVDNLALRAEIADVSKVAGEQAARIRLLEDLERPESVKVFLDVAGNEHASQRGAVEATARLLGLEPAIVQDAVRTISPTPALETAP